MDDETRAQYEGFRPGVYVRVEVRLVYVIPFTLFSYYSLSAQLRRSWRFPVVPTVDLHALPRVLCQGTNFVRKGGGGGGGSGLISFAAYSWNRILGLPGLGVVHSVCRSKGPLGAPKSMAQESDLLGFN